jgi:hypothetical protein
MVSDFKNSIGSINTETGSAKIMILSMIYAMV